MEVGRPAPVERSSTYTSRGFLGVCLAAVFLIGGMATYRAGRAEDARMRNELLTLARTGMKAIDPQLVARLSGAASDLEDPDIRKLRDQVAAIRSANPRCRFAYIVDVKEDGSVYFLLDSELPGSPDYAPPGQSYEEAPALVRESFSRCSEEVEGPYTDRWGSWVTALTPVVRSSDQKPLGIFCMDIDARDWRARILLSCLTPLLVTLLFAALLLFFLVLLRRANAAHRLIAASEARLAASERLFRTVVSSARDAIVMMGPDSEVILWSPASESMFGWTAEEAKSRSVHSLLASPAQQEAFAVGFAKIQASGEGMAVGQILELDARHKDGHLIPVELSLSALRLDGRWCAVGILRDITLRRQREEALRRSKNELEQTNRELEDVLQRANELALQASLASAAKSEFLANMSHEIRTPMNGVIGMTTLLLETELSGEQRQYAEVIHGSAEALLSIINDILDFSKIEAGRMELECIDFDLRTTVDAVVELLAVKAAGKGLEFAAMVHADVPSLLRGDPGRLRQVLLNITGNAIKFTEMGEVVLRVLLEVETEAEARLCFEITDTGIGIPLERREAIFEPFTQADGSTTRKFGGTGLGLSISRRLIAQMGGQIELESEPGRGTTFWFTLPFQKQAIMPELPVPEATLLEGKRIILVDDNATNRGILKAQLADCGCSCVEAESGDAALELLRRAYADRNAFDLAILDLLMPGMDGMTLATLIKSDPMLRDTILVLLSSAGQRGDGARAHEIGFAAYLNKPVLKPETLRRCLEYALADAPAAGEHDRRPLITRHLLDETARRNIRILVADDNETNQQVAQGILTKLGYRADTASNGLEVLDMVRRNHYDLILMDCQMPEMDGFETTAALRALESGERHMPIVALTAHVQLEDREKCLAAGMDGYLAKPLRPQELANEIARLISPKLAGNAHLVHMIAEERPRTVFDQIAFLDRIGNDKRLAHDVIELAICDLPELLTAWEQALLTHDLQAVAQQTHTLKGAAATLEAHALREAARAGEVAARTGDEETCAAVLDTARRESETLLVEFRAFLQRA